MKPAQFRLGTLLRLVALLGIWFAILADLGEHACFLPAAFLGTLAGLGATPKTLRWACFFIAVVGCLLALCAFVVNMEEFYLIIADARDAAVAMEHARRAMARIACVLAASLLPYIAAGCVVFHIPEPRWPYDPSPAKKALSRALFFVTLCVVFAFGEFTHGISLSMNNNGRAFLRCSVAWLLAKCSAPSRNRSFAAHRGGRSPSCSAQCLPLPWTPRFGACDRWNRNARPSYCSRLRFVSLL